MRRARPSHDSPPTPRAGHASTETRLLGGSLRLVQPLHGYRVNADTLLLAWFVARHRSRAGRVLDLGAGVGALGLCLARRASVSHLDALERDPSLVAMGAKNLGAAGIPGGLRLVDLERDGLPRDLRGLADTVVANPPFFPISASTAAAGARGPARGGSVGPFLTAARGALARRGRAYFVYPARTLAAFLAGAEVAGLFAKRVRAVHAFRHRPARIVLLELLPGRPGGLEIEPPLVEWAAPRVATEEAKLAFSAP